MLARILIGLAITAVGFGMIKKPEVAMDFLGDTEIAYKLFSGGGLVFYKMVGVLVCILGLMVVTNLYTKLLEWGFSFLG